MLSTEEQRKVIEHWALTHARYKAAENARIDAEAELGKAEKAAMDAVMDAVANLFTEFGVPTGLHSSWENLCLKVTNSLLGGNALVP